MRLSLRFEQKSRIAGAPRISTTEDCSAMKIQKSLLICLALPSLTLPRSVCVIGKGVFADCPVTLTVEHNFSPPAAQYA